jgi:transcriptional regulator with XRE-family HTH domain
MSEPTASELPAWLPLIHDEMRDLQKLQVAALERAQHLVTILPEGTRGNCETALGLMQAALAVLTRQGDPEDVPGALDPQRFQAFAELLQQRRRGAHLSREHLAMRAGLSPSTIKNIERLKQPPSRTTLCRLLAVPELALQVRDIAEDVTADPDWRPNAWFAPRYDAARLFGEMVEMLGGPGGTLEQTYLYLDPQSASDWLAICNSERFTSSWRSACPLDQVAAKIVRQVGKSGVDVVGLGVGDGKNETRLVQAIAELRPRPAALSLKLLDISHTLVSTASKHATETLAPHQVPVVALHANFHDLARYPVLQCTPQSAHLRRVYTLLGYTMANLDNEVRWFEDLTSCTAAGDLAVLDFQLGYGPPEDADALWRQDPGLKGGMPSGYQGWLSGPIRRHCPNAGTIEFETKLQTQCLVPGAYELQAVARVRLPDGAERRFTVFRNRRYDAERLAQCLERLGWECLASLKYGVGATKTAAVMLLRRR